MLDTMFVETVSRAISDYRQILKKYLSPQERASKIAELRLKDHTIFDDEPTLYRVVHYILKDIEKNISVPNEGYYSYYGIVRFAKYLREYVDNYSLEGNVVIHKAQKASNLLIKIIQILSVPGEQFNEKLAQEVIAAHPAIIELSSKEQLDLYTQTLDRCLREKNKAFHLKIVSDFRARMDATLAVAA